MIKQLFSLAGIMDSLKKSTGGYVKTEDLQEAVKEALEQLSRFETVIGGGFAVAIHGFTRATRDIDFVARIPFKEVKILLEEKGFQFDSTISFGKQGRIHLFEKNGAGVDILEFDDDGFYNSILRRAIKTDLLGHTVKVMSIEDLILTKVLSFRAKDQIDLLELLKKTFDELYLKKWISHFHLENSWKEIKEKI
jgi:predicted nucleotidyltransferase